MSSLLAKVRRDLDDEEHDAKVRSGELKEDTRILRDWCQCPSPDACRFTDTECSVCRRRESAYPETGALMQLAQAMLGGMPMQRDELPYATWCALGEIRSRMGGGL